MTLRNCLAAVLAILTGARADQQAPGSLQEQ